jgi:hypothetical protein
MCLMGQKQTFSESKPMSALPPKADIRDTHRHVWFGPTTDVAFAEMRRCCLGGVRAKNRDDRRRSPAGVSLFQM